LSDHAGQPHTVVHGNVLKGHERHHIRCADAGVHPLVSAKVDKFRRPDDDAPRGLADGVGRAGERQDRSVVVGIHRPMQKPHVRHGDDRGDESLDDGPVSAFAEVGDTFNQRWHRASVKRESRKKGAFLPTP